MVLQVAESKPRSRLDAGRVCELLSQHKKQLSPAAEDLHRQPERTFGPETPGLLYLHQREFAVLPLMDERGPLIVGTDEATTCHIVVLLSQRLRLLAFAHVDGSGVQQFFADVVLLMRRLGDDLSDGVEAHLVGGFLDPQRESQRLSAELLKCMAKSEVLFRLRTAVLLDLNDEVRGDSHLHYPRRYGLAVDMAASRAEDSLRLLPATFEAFGPCPELRRTRFCCPDERMSNVYDPETASLVLQPFHYHPPENLADLVNSSDDQLRRYSTSPQQEREGFEQRLRATCRFMLQNPQPRSHVFHEDQALSFRLQAGHWQLDSS